MSFHYLSHLAELGTADIHPLGHQATQALIDALDLQAGHQVLEIGCGTGNTAILISNTKDVEVVGIDILPEMLSAARKRILWAGNTKRVQILQASAISLPFCSNSFDRIYTESVLGFQDERRAERMLAEIFRTLKPGGLYVANEAIWKEDVSQAIVDAIHDTSMDDFGLCQASPQAWSLKHWLNVMRQAGFAVLSSSLLGSVVADPPASPPSTNLSSSLKQMLLRLRLDWFSSFYQLRRHWHPRLRRANRTYEERLQKHRQDGQYIEARLIVLQKSEL
jgi:ubiquinone/menaquinone biosynthesis C-methylase UbiE